MGTTPLLELVGVGPVPMVHGAEFPSLPLKAQHSGEFAPRSYYISEKYYFADKKKNTCEYSS